MRDLVVDTERNVLRKDTERERVKLKEAVSIESRIVGAGNIIIASLNGASDDELVKQG